MRHSSEQLQHAPSRGIVDVHEFRYHKRHGHAAIAWGAVDDLQALGVLDFFQAVTVGERDDSVDIARRARLSELGVDATLD